MFRNLLSRLLGDNGPSGSLSPVDAEVAIAALLVRIARADDHYTDREAARIDRILAQRRGISIDQAAERRSAAEMIEAEAPDTVRFTKLIKERVALDDRQAVIRAMWDVALSDGSRTADEETLIRLVSGLLGVTDRDSALERQKILRRQGLAAG
ncbi:TerB family tellurite resistance protein [Paracoccus pacificus]|uniref:TerB family tellurite resistance protein n=1 Tax=Paracoccus pacificus TaxID=1463598 RepID=A0ABW4R9H9_9RHOB